MDDDNNDSSNEVVFDSNPNDDIITEDERHVHDWQDSPNTQTKNSGKVGLIIFIVFVLLIILSAIFGG